MIATLPPDFEKLTSNQKIEFALTNGLIPIIGYIRVSTWREEAISPEIQMAAINDAAGRKGRVVVVWIVDLDATGRNFKRRIMEAIEAVEQRTYQAKEIWVWKFSRFGRSRHGVAINLARVEHARGQLVSATEDIDATTATGRFARGMLFEVAAFESDRASEQWKETHALRRLRGLPATGGRRFGYVWHPRRVADPDSRGGWILQHEWYEVDQVPAEAVLEAFQQYNVGRTGFGRLADAWNHAGLATMRGGRWQDQTVSWYLDSGFAAGLLWVHDPEIDCAAGRRCHKRDHCIYLPAEHEALITGEEWDAYLDRRQARRSTPARALQPVYPLSGLMRCAVCHGSARVHTVRGVAAYAYRCAQRAAKRVDHEAVYRRRELIERDVLEWLRGVRDEIESLAAGTVVTSEPEPTRIDAERDRALALKEQGRLADALDRATAAFVEGVIPRDSYERTRDRLVAEQRACERRIEAISAAEVPAGPAAHTETVSGLIEEWDTIDVGSKRVLLAAVIRAVEITSTETRIMPVWAPLPQLELV